MAKRNGYDLSRQWFNFAFEKEEAKVIHTAIYMWIVELNNRLGWKQEFGLPTLDTMEGLSIGNKMTYLAAIKDLVEWNFIEIVKESKNQYQSMIIKICHSKNATARGTALDTALQQHDIQHCNGTIDGIGVSTAPIDKPTTIKPRNQKPKTNVTTPPSDPKKFIPPTVEEVTAYFLEKGYTESAAVRAWNYYDTGKWKDSKGSQVKNWKQKMQGVWFRPENEAPKANGYENLKGYNPELHDNPLWRYEISPTGAAIGYFRK